MKVHTATRRRIRHGLMLLWFADLINVTEEVTVVTSSVTCSLLKIFLYNSQSGQIHYYCIFYIILQSWWKNFSQPCTGTMRVWVNLYTDLMICRHFVRLVHHISFTSSSVQQWVQIDMPPVRGTHIHSSKEQLHYFTSSLPA